MRLRIALQVVLSAVAGLVLASCSSGAEMLRTPSDFYPAANITMAQAVEIAEARFPGSFAVSAELDPETVGYEYEVIVFHEGEYWEVEIDTVDGRIKGVEREDSSEGDIELAEDDARDAPSKDARNAGGPAGTAVASGAPPS